MYTFKSHIPYILRKVDWMISLRRNKTEKQPDFGIISGASGLPKNIGISGDSYICRKLPQNRYVIAIADGMGAGPEAARCSRFVLDSLYQLLRVGLDGQSIATSLNAAIPSHMHDEYFTTLDMAVFDFNEGMCHMFKSGAAPTIIQRNDDIGVIRLPSMPLGIMDRADCRSISFEIQHGDRFFFMSDGVSEAIPADDELSWAFRLIRDNPEDTPRSMAERLIWGATLRYGQAERDDMTVVSAEII